MLSIFTSTMFIFNRPIDHQSTSNDWLKPVMSTGLVNMHIDWSIANIGNHDRNVKSEKQVFAMLYHRLHSSFRVTSLCDS